MNVLDFTKKERPSLTVKLPDDKNTTINVLTPTKEVEDAFTYLGELLIRASKNEATVDDLDTIFTISAKIMSRNKENQKISKSQLTKCLELEDIITFLHTYIDFITDVVKSKN